MKYNVKLLLLFLISFWFAVSSAIAGDLSTAGKQAFFDEGTAKNYLFWDIKEKTLWALDLGIQIEICENDLLIICIKAPIPIFLPAKLDATVVFKIEEEFFRVEAFPIPYETLQEQVCDNEVVWLKIENLRTGEYYWELISKRNGLKEIIEFRNELTDYFMPTTYALNTGKILAYGELEHCKEN